MRKKTTTLNPRNLRFAKPQITFLRNKISTFVLFDTILRSIIAYMGPYESQGNHFKYTIIIPLVPSLLIYYCAIGLPISKLLGTKLGGWNWFSYGFMAANYFRFRLFGIWVHIFMGMTFYRCLDFVLWALFCKFGELPKYMILHSIWLIYERFIYQMFLIIYTKSNSKY